MWFKSAHSFFRRYFSYSVTYQQAVFLQRFAIILLFSNLPSMHSFRHWAAIFLVILWNFSEQLVDFLQNNLYDCSTTFVIKFIVNGKFLLYFRNLLTTLFFRWCDSIWKCLSFLLFYNRSPMVKGYGLTISGRR
jgi:hypothetical protein